MLSKVTGWLGMAVLAVVGAVRAFGLLMIVFVVALFGAAHFGW